MLRKEGSVKVLFVLRLEAVMQHLSVVIKLCDSAHDVIDLNCHPH